MEAEGPQVCKGLLGLEGHQGLDTVVDHADADLC